MRWISPQEHQRRGQSPGRHPVVVRTAASGRRLGGLSPASSAKSLRAQPDGKVLIIDGPYLETKEHIGGFWVLEAADLDEALAWGRKAVVACRAPVEVRPFGTPQ